MELKEKIRMFRELKQMSQEEMAHKMNMSLSGYAKLERGETKLHYDKLVQIAQIFSIDVVDLISSEKGVVFFMNENSDYICTNYNNSNESLAAENERLKLIVAHKEELLQQKQTEIEMLRKMLALLEQKSA